MRFFLLADLGHLQNIDLRPLISLLARQKRAELKSVLDSQTKKRVGSYPLMLHASGKCLITRRRNPHPTSKEARA